MTLESTNFSLNSDEYHRIKNLSSSVENKDLILIWQFTIKTLEELDIVSNQHLSIEMFLIRILHLRSLNKKDDTLNNEQPDQLEKVNFEYKNKENDYVDQIKSVTQEKKINPVRKTTTDSVKKDSIISFDQLLEICNERKEMKLKYELEKNVNLVGFYKNRIEISFNDNLDKNFVKDLSLRLFEWTGQRWIIAFSKTQGELSVKEKKENKKNELIEKFKNTELYKNVIKNFPDAKLKDINKLDGSDD